MINGRFFQRCLDMKYALIMNIKYVPLNIPLSYLASNRILVFCWICSNLLTSTLKLNPLM